MARKARVFGQLKNAIDSAQLSDVVKLTCLKTLVTGKTKTAVSENAFRGAIYETAVKTFEWKFGLSQTVVTANLDKL